jgi:adenine phosphoribosyltransferase
VSAEELRAKIREVPDFPKPGILFYDITTLLKDATAYREAIDLMLAPYAGERIDIVVGMESRGFIFSAPMAYQLNAGLVPVRKLGNCGRGPLRQYARVRVVSSITGTRSAAEGARGRQPLATGGTSRARSSSSSASGARSWAWRSSSSSTSSRAATGSRRIG